MILEKRNLARNIFPGPGVPAVRFLVSAGADSPNKREWTPGFLTQIVWLAMSDFGQVSKTCTRQIDPW